jgi:hypothetical protein
MCISAAMPLQSSRSNYRPLAIPPIWVGETGTDWKEGSMATSPRQRTDVAFGAAEDAVRASIEAAEKIARTSLQAGSDAARTVQGSLRTALEALVPSDASHRAGSRSHRSSGSSASSSARRS